MLFSELQLPGKLFRRSKPGRPALRIGLRIDGPTMTAWAQAVVQDLLLADFIQIVDVQVLPRTRWWSESVAGAIAHVLFRSLDRIYRLQHDPLAPRRVPPSLADRRSDEPLDVCLDLSSAGGGWQRKSLHGLWTLQLGEQVAGPAWPPFGREMLRGETLRRVELQRRDAPDASPEILCRADFPSDPYPSARSNLIGPLWGASHFFLQKLNELHQQGSVKPDGCEASSTSHALRAEPRLREVCGWILRQVATRLDRRRRPKGENPVWRMAIRRSKVSLPESPTEESVAAFRWIDELGDQSAADPFLFEEGGKLWLFFESIDRQSGHGHIACGWIDESGRLQEEHSVLKSDSHLSYPHLIRDGDHIYMLPESSESGGLDLYRARRFPDEWEKIGRLLDIPCVDATVFWHEGTWWMFTSPMATSGSVALTWLLKADRLEGPWEYQLSGPASCTALTARAAGEVFRLGGRLIRPSQDCGESYGRAIVFNEILSLGSDHYEERTLCRVESKPFPGLVGLHTYNRIGEWEVIDGLFASGDE